MSTTKQEKQPHVLTAKNGLFYGADKVMTDFGDKLKVYANLGSAQAATRMLAKSDNILTPISLADAKNGKATQMQADSEKALEEGTEQAAKETSEEILAAKETREFAEMLVVTYGHITADKAVQEKIHNFSLSPVGKRVDFNADFIRVLLSDYDDATESIPTPANKSALLTQIGSQQVKMGKYRVTFADDPDTLDDLLAGLKAKIAPLQTELAELPDENRLIFSALVLLPLCGKLFSEKALKPSTRGKNGNGQAWVMAEEQFLAFDYSSTRVCQNGLDLSKLGLTSIQGFIYHPDHENVKSLSIPTGKLAVVDHNHVLVGQIDGKQALGNVLGEAVFEIAKPNIDRAKFVQAVSSTGVDTFQSGKSAILSETAKAVSANTVKDGQHSELETVGQNADTEKDHAPIVE